MKFRSLNTPLFVAAFLAVSTGLFAADVPAKPDMPLPVDVQNVMNQFSAQRDAMIADRQTLVDQLKTATAEQQKAILAKMQEQQKSLLETQRALAKQIRDELRKLRQSQPAGGGR